VCNDYSVIILSNYGLRKGMNTEYITYISFHLVLPVLGMLTQIHNTLQLCCDPRSRATCNSFLTYTSILIRSPSYRWDSAGIFCISFRFKELSSVNSDRIRKTRPSAPCVLLSNWPRRCFRSNAQIRSKKLTSLPPCSYKATCPNRSRRED